MPSGSPSGAANSSIYPRPSASPTINTVDVGGSGRAFTVTITGSNLEPVLQMILAPNGGTPPSTSCVITRRYTAPPNPQLISLTGTSSYSDSEIANTLWNGFNVQLTTSDPTFNGQFTVAGLAASATYPVATRPIPASILQTQSSSLVVNGTTGIGGTNHPTTQLRIRGSTSDSSRYALQIADSTSTPLFRVRNDGQITLGTQNFLNDPNLNTTLTMNGDATFGGVSNSKAEVIRDTTVSGTLIQNVSSANPLKFSQLGIGPGLTAASFNPTTFRSPQPAQVQIVSDGSPLQVARSSFFSNWPLFGIDSSGNVGVGQPPAPRPAISPTPTSLLPNVAVNGNIYMNGGASLILSPRPIPPCNATTLNFFIQDSQGFPCICNSAQRWVHTGDGSGCATHGLSDCTNANGTPFTDTTTNSDFCFFPLASCPAGWNQIANWSSTQGRSGLDGGSDTGCCCGHEFGSTTGHTRANLPVESTCVPRVRACGGIGTNGCTTYFSIVTEIGCY